MSLVKYSSIHPEPEGFLRARKACEFLLGVYDLKSDRHVDSVVGKKTKSPKS